MVASGIAIYPAGYWESSQDPATVASLDATSFTGSTAQQSGMSWEVYQTLVQEIRYTEMVASNTEFNNSLGGYGGAFGGDDEMGHVSGNFGHFGQQDAAAFYGAPPSQIAAVWQQDLSRFNSPTDVIAAIDAGGYYKTISGSLVSYNGAAPEPQPSFQIWVPIGAGSSQGGRFQANGVSGAATAQSAIPFGAGAKSLSEAAVIAQKIALEEKERTRLLTNNYSIGGHNDIFDAERHARWVYRMSVEIGSGWAGLFAAGHEAEGIAKGQPLIEAQMDAANNSFGMNAAINGSGIPTLSTPGLTYIENGRLVQNGS